MALRYKEYGQQTFWDEALKKKVRRKRTTILKEVNEYIDFEIFRPTIEKTLSESVFGPARYDVILMWRIVILQQWYELSDPEAEEQISDRISFRDFLGLSVNDDIPDETTICLFRNHLMETGVYEWLFETLNQELDKRHVRVKAGNIIDATFIEAPKGKRKNGQKTDPDADWGHKGHGYSMHTNVGSNTKLIDEVEVSSARSHDSQYIDDVLIGDETAIFADSAYANDAKKRRMRAEGVYCGVLDKAKRNHPLSSSQKKQNKKKSSVRVRGEHQYAQLKYHQEYDRTRYIGLRKNRCHAFLKALSYNLRRGVYLLKQQAQGVVQGMTKQLDTQLAPYCA